MKVEFGDALKNVRPPIDVGQFKKREHQPPKLANLTEREILFLDILKKGMPRDAKRVLSPNEILRKLRKNLNYSDEMLTKELAETVVRIFDLAAKKPDGGVFASSKHADAIKEAFGMIVASRDFKPENLGIWLKTMEIKG